jgi:signal transduction histidine kinase
MTAVAESSDLVAVLRVYNEATEKLKASHEALAGEVHRLRGELNEKNRELQRRENLAALGQMAAGVAHEIRNPLGGIGLYASILQKELTDRPRQCDIARRISEGVENLERIVRDILAFAGNGTQRREAVNLGALMKSVDSQLERAVADAGATFEGADGLDEVWVRGDAGRIERAVLNLCFNAIEAAGQGGRVRVRCGPRDGETATIVVEDDGAGIDPAILHKIFNPFFTTKDCGTGLGLAIVHSIAESHGGFVRAGNRPGGGACFTLTLPGAEPGLRTRIG